MNDQVLGVSESSSQHDHVFTDHRVVAAVFEKLVFVDDPVSVRVQLLENLVVPLLDNIKEPQSHCHTNGREKKLPLNAICGQY